MLVKSVAAATSSTYPGNPETIMNTLSNTANMRFRSPCFFSFIFLLSFPFYLNAATLYHGHTFIPFAPLLHFCNKPSLIQYDYKTIYHTPIQKIRKKSNA